MVSLKSREGLIWLALFFFSFIFDVFPRFVITQEFSTPLLFFHRQMSFSSDIKVAGIKECWNWLFSSDSTEFRFGYFGYTYRNGQNLTWEKMRTFQFRSAYEFDSDLALWFFTSSEGYCALMTLRLRLLFFTSFKGTYDSDSDSVFWFSLRLKVLITPILTPFILFSAS